MNKNDFINFMTEAGVLTFGDFTTKSGRKTPYFVNTGGFKTGKHISTLGDYYADCIIQSGEKYDALYGPAYKGITLAAATASSLYRNHGIDIPYFFNRKEAKDHGEGGVIVGYAFENKDSILMVEDVITAGTAVRETLPVIKQQADADVCGLIISVDRMERGAGEKTAIQEIKEEFGIETFPIVTVREIIEELHNTEIDGKIAIDDAMREKMEDYLKMYCEL